MSHTKTKPPLQTTTIPRQPFVPRRRYSKPFAQFFQGDEAIPQSYRQCILAREGIACFFSLSSASSRVSQRTQAKHYIPSITFHSQCVMGEYSSIGHLLIHPPKPLPSLWPFQVNQHNVSMYISLLFLHSETERIDYKISILIFVPSITSPWVEIAS